MEKCDTDARKLHPRLRMLKNGDRAVNAVRSDGSTTVACTAPVDDKATLSAPAYTRAMLPMAQSQAVAHIRRSGKLGLRPKLAGSPPADDVYVNVFIEFIASRIDGTETQEAAMKRLEGEIKKRLGSVDRTRIREAIVTRRNVMSATVPVSMLEDLQLDPAIAFIHPATPLKFDRPIASGAKSKVSKSVGNAAKYGDGGNVLIGIVDVGGFDFAHPDFIDADGTTRFVTIWDQGGDFREPPKDFPYGSELRKVRLDAAIAAAKTAGLPPASWIERQSQRVEGSHGTHVASIAAGKSGVCPKAKIAAVLIDVPAPDDPIERRRTTFSDTSRITHAIEYLLGIAKEYQLPISINVSLGTNGGSHDGSGGVSRWLDAYLSSPGRAICVAAGNAGQESSQSEDDLGWMMGRIHTSGRIPARGLEVEIEWTVVGDGIEDISENELEIWYGAQDRFIVSLKAPDATEWIEVQPRHYLENRRLPSGTTLSIYNELFHPTNGGNYISIYLSPNLDPQDYRGIQPGVWKIRLKGEEVRDGKFDAWIERDDPVEVGSAGGRRYFRFPSFFSSKSTIDSHSISSLACGHRVIAVANLDDVRQRINPTSSQGPTRDGRCKPEIAAPGTDIVAANGFGEQGKLWVSMTGTSMASPYVAGVVGLMLNANPHLTAAQCGGILQRTARPLPGASYQWVNDVGFGTIDPKAAIEEARAINRRVLMK